ncbi:MAG TPA: hypothetical protein VM144_03140 [Aestuariivirga sp.]|nr:hypothetical protein [Aestuariivirga sp.]
MAFDRVFRPAILLIAIAVLFAGQIAIRLGSDLNNDTAWYLYVAQGLLNGGELYRDFVEVNPPLGIWLTVPVVMLSRATGLAPIETLYAVFFAITAMSLLLAWRYLAMIRGLPKGIAGLVLFLLAAAFLFIPGSTFGQREHLLVLLFMPWFMLRVVRSQGALVPVTESAIIGLLGAVAICLKPHAILAPLVLEAMLLLRQRSLHGVFAPENLAAVVFAVIYGVAIVILCPLFLTDMLHFGVVAYVPYYGFDAASIMKLSARPALVLALALVLIYTAKGPMRELAGLAFAAAVGFLAAYFLQSKGFYYQIMPAQIFAVASGIFALAGILGAWNAGEARRSPVVPAIVVFAIALLSISPQAYVYRGAAFSVAISQYFRDAKSVFIASTNLSNGFPLAVRENLIWGSRFPTLWLTPYVADRWQDGPLPDDPIIAYALDALVTDLVKFRPDVVFINQSTTQDYIKGGTFDYLKFMAQDPRFEAIWNTYELRGQAGKFAVYVAKSS